MSLPRRRLLVLLLQLPVVAGIATFARSSFARAVRPPPDSHASRTVSTLIDRMIPGDGMPGALALGVDRGVLDTPELWTSFVRGVRVLDAVARRYGGRDFLGLTEAAQIDVMTKAWAVRNSAAEQMLAKLWYRSATLYYSEPAVQQHFAYAGPPQPAGFMDFAQPPA